MHENWLFPASLKLFFKVEFTRQVILSPNIHPNIWNLKKSGLLEIIAIIAINLLGSQQINGYAADKALLYFLSFYLISQMSFKLLRGYIWLPKPNMCGVCKRCSQRPVTESCSFSCKQSDRSLLCIVWKYAEIILNLLL